jgi:hypothetical protein
VPAYRLENKSGWETKEGKGPERGSGQRREEAREKKRPEKRRSQRRVVAREM